MKLCRNHNLKDLLSQYLASYISEVFYHLLQCGKHMFSVGMRTATENLVKWYFFNLAHESSFQTWSVYFLSFPSKTKKKQNSQFSAQKDTKVSIWKFTSVLTFYNLNSQLEVWLNHPTNSPLNDWGRKKYDGLRSLSNFMSAWTKSLNAFHNSFLQFLKIVCWGKLADILVHFHVFRRVAIGLIVNERQVLFQK